MCCVSMWFFRFLTLLPILVSAISRSSPDDSPLSNSYGLPHRPTHVITARAVVNVPFSGPSSSTGEEKEEKTASNGEDDNKLPEVTRSRNDLQTTYGAYSTLLSLASQTATPFPSATEVSTPQSNSTSPLLPEEVILRKLPSAALLGSNDLTFSSVISLSGRLILGGVGFLLFIALLVCQRCFPRQLAVMLFSLVMLLGGSIFSVLQVGAEHGKVNRPLFVLAQLQYSIALVGLHLWQIAMLDTLGAWPAQVEGQIGARIRRRRHSTALSNLQARNSPSKRRQDQLPRIAALSAIIVLSVLTPTWRLSMRLGRLDIVTSVSRVAEAVSLSFIALSLILLARIDVGAKRRLNFARCLNMTGNVVEGAVLSVSLGYVGFQEAPLGSLLSSLVMLLFLTASVLIYWPMLCSQGRRGETSLDSPMREISHSILQSPSVQDLQPQAASDAAPSSPRFSLPSTFLVHDPFYDSSENGCWTDGRYTGSIPRITVEGHSSFLRGLTRHRRPSSEASTHVSSVSHLTSQVSLDSDQIHMATAQLMEAPIRLKSAGVARLIQIPSNSLSFTRAWQENSIRRPLARKEETQAARSRSSKSSRPQSRTQSTHPRCSLADIESDDDESTFNSMQDLTDAVFASPVVCEEMTARDVLDVDKQRCGRQDSAYRNARLALSRNDYKPETAGWLYFSAPSMAHLAQAESALLIDPTHNGGEHSASVTTLPESPAFLLSPPTDFWPE